MEEDTQDAPGSAGQNGAHTPGRVMAGILRQTAYFRANPNDADATPMDVLSVADHASLIDQQRAVLERAVVRVLAWHDRQGGHGAIPSDVEAELRAAIAAATGEGK